MNNLIINGIDYNAELELLKEYMREMIDASLHCIKIDVCNLKKNEVDDFINTFRRTGLVMRNSAILDSYIAPIETISFDKWKEIRMDVDGIYYKGMVYGGMTFPMKPR